MMVLYDAQKDQVVRGLKGGKKDGLKDVVDDESHVGEDLAVKQGWQPR
jgi:hypothetical protein